MGTLSKSRRRMVLAAAAAGLLAARPPGALAQAVRKLGILWGGSRESFDAEFRRLVEALAALGHVEGRNLAIDARFAERDGQDLQFARELVAARPALIFAQGTHVTRELQKATTSIPLVVAVGDPVRSGFAESVARPAGNITGVYWGDSEIAAKRFQLLRQIAPRIDRVALLGVSEESRAGLESAARNNGLRPEIAPVRRREELEPFLRNHSDGGRGALLVVPFPNDVLKHIADMSIRYGVPAAGFDSDFAAAGGLLSLRMDTTGFEARCASIIDRILRGANPADIPFEMPERTLLVINRRTALALGLTIPRDVLIRANRVVE